MKNDLRDACLGLIMSRTNGSLLGRSPRPAALGWKLESGLVPAADLDGLRASIQGALAGTATPRRWTTSALLRALLAEYQEVRRSAGPLHSGERVARRGRTARPLGRSDTRPTDCM